MNEEVSYASKFTIGDIVDVDFGSQGILQGWIIKVELTSKNVFYDIELDVSSKQSDSEKSDFRKIYHVKESYLTRSKRWHSFTETHFLGIEKKEKN